MHFRTDVRHPGVTIVRHPGVTIVRHPGVTIVRHPGVHEAGIRVSRGLLNRFLDAGLAHSGIKRAGEKTPFSR